MNCKYLYSIFIIVLHLSVSSCTTIGIANHSMDTKIKEHRLGKEVNKIHVFLNKSKLIVQYTAKVYSKIIGDRPRFPMSAIRSRKLKVW